MIIENLRKYLKFVQNLWMGIDFLGESGRWPARGSQAGLLNLCGYIKPRGYMRQSLWSETPMAYVTTFSGFFADNYWLTFRQQAKQAP